MLLFNFWSLNTARSHHSPRLQMGTFIIAVLSCVQWTGTVVPLLSVSRWEYLTLALPAVSAVPPIMLLIGNRKNFPAMYWPHIVFHVSAVLEGKFATKNQYQTQIFENTKNL